MKSSPILLGTNRSLKKQDLENIGCAVIVRNAQGQILLGKRKNAYRSGTYGFPGGRIEKQEKALAAAKRELEEETGLMAKTLRYVGVVKEWQKSFTFIHFIYECTEWEGDVMLKEPEKCEAWEWFDEKSLPEEILPGHYQGLELIKSDIGGLRDLV